jgi:hypothetical protein
MKKLLLLILAGSCLAEQASSLALTIRLSFTQSVGIGTTTPNNRTMLDVQSNAKGMLIPRMTTAQRAAM